MLDAPGGLQAVATRHADVHAHHIGLEALRHGEGLFAGAGFPNNLDVAGGLENCGQSGADECFVVGDDYPN